MSKSYSKNHKVIIIAEAGVNHDGSLNKAKKLIDAASSAGADYVKFQTYKVSKLILKSTPKAQYQKKNTRSSSSQYSMLKKLELTYEDHHNLIKYSNKKKIRFLSSAFDIESLEFLGKLNLDFIKIPSGEIDNYPYLIQVGKKNKKTILSTGMSNIAEIKKAVKILIKSGLNKKKLTILQCNSEYPSPINNANINAMVTLKKTFGVNVGYSDHTLGYESALAAVALGATLIEKHITLSKKDTGPDHSASLTPKEFSEFIKMINNINTSLGSFYKLPSKKELNNRNIVRKKIFSSRDIKKGEKFDSNNLITLRAKNGLSSSKWFDIIGKKAKKNYKKYEKIICL